MAGEPVEAINGPSPADIVDPNAVNTINSTSQPSVNIDHLRRYDKSCCLSVLEQQYLHPTSPYFHRVTGKAAAVLAVHIFTCIW